MNNTTVRGFSNTFVQRKHNRIYFNTTYAVMEIWTAPEFTGFATYSIRNSFCINVFTQVHKFPFAKKYLSGNCKDFKRYF